MITNTGRHDIFFYGSLIYIKIAVSLVFISPINYLDPGESFAPGQSNMQQCAVPDRPAFIETMHLNITE